MDEKGMHYLLLGGQEEAGSQSQREAHLVGSRSGSSEKDSLQLCNFWLGGVRAVTNSSLLASLRNFGPFCILVGSDECNYHKGIKRDSEALTLGHCPALHSSIWL